MTARHNEFTPDEALALYLEKLRATNPEPDVLKLIEELLEGVELHPAGRHRKAVDESADRVVSA